MTDLRVLREAFAELERRADAAVPPEFSPQPARLAEPPRKPLRWPRLVPVAAAVAVAAGLVAGGILLNPEGGTRTGATAATSAAPPSTPEELADQFRTALGDTATFTVLGTEPTEPLIIRSLGTFSSPGAEGQVITGTLTASGVTGDFVLQAYRDDTKPETWCAQAPAPAQCAFSFSPDRTVVIAQLHTSDTPEGRIEAASVVVNGVRIALQVSNSRDGEVVAPQPPLSAQQMVPILRRW